MIFSAIFGEMCSGHWIIKRDKWILQTIIPGQDKTPIGDWDECTCFNNRVGLSVLTNTIRIFIRWMFPRSLVGFCVANCRYWPTYPPMDVRLPHELNVYQVGESYWISAFNCRQHHCTSRWLFQSFLLLGAIGHFQGVLFEQVQWEALNVAKFIRSLCIKSRIS